MLYPLKNKVNQFINLHIAIKNVYFYQWFQELLIVAVHDLLTFCWDWKSSTEIFTYLWNFILKLTDWRRKYTIKVKRWQFLHLHYGMDVSSLLIIFVVKMFWHNYLILILLKFEQQVAKLYNTLTAYLLQCNRKKNQIITTIVIVNS